MRCTRGSDVIQEQGAPSDSLVFVVSGSLRMASTLTLRQSHRVPLRHNAWQLTEVQTTRQCLLDRVCASDFCLEEAVLLPGAPCASPPLPSPPSPLALLPPSSLFH